MKSYAASSVSPLNFNHANFATPNPAVFNAGVVPTVSATAGQITSIVGNARQTQFSLKLLF